MDRRKFPRVEASNPVLYFTDSYAHPALAWTRDLSLGGMRIEPSDGLVPGKRFWITVPIEPQTVKCRAKTVYILVPGSGTTEAGIEFEGLSGDEELFLRNYLSWHAEERA